MLGLPNHPGTRKYKCNCSREGEAGWVRGGHWVAPPTFPPGGSMDGVEAGLPRRTTIRRSMLRPVDKHEVVGILPEANWEGFGDASRSAPTCERGAPKRSG
jgi:hypothetical protein